MPSNHLAFDLISGSKILHEYSLKKKNMQTLNELIQSVEYEIREKSIDNALDLLASFDRYVGKDWKCYFYSLKNESPYYVVHQDDDFKLELV